MKSPPFHPSRHRLSALKIPVLRRRNRCCTIRALDVYLVSNINGSPLGADGNGFITRVAPDGTVTNLKWIDGESEVVTLNAPKGMAIIGDTLYVADITHVRFFHRDTGEPLGEIEIPGATFVNDLAAGRGGWLFVSDTDVSARTGRRTPVRPRSTP